MVAYANAEAADEDGRDRLRPLLEPQPGRPLAEGRDVGEPAARARGSDRLRPRRASCSWWNPRVRRATRARAPASAMRRHGGRHPRRGRTGHRRTRPLGGEDSYTARLLGKGLDHILKKIGEEATEVVLAAKGETGRERWRRKRPTSSSTCSWPCPSGRASRCGPRRAAAAEGGQVKTLSFDDYERLSEGGGPSPCTARSRATCSRRSPPSWPSPPTASRSAPFCSRA